MLYSAPWERDEFIGIRIERVDLRSGQRETSAGLRGEYFHAQRGRRNASLGIYMEDLVVSVCAEIHCSARTAKHPWGFVRKSLIFTANSATVPWGEL